MSKKATTCIGQTYAELQVWVIAFAADFPGSFPPGVDTIPGAADLAVEEMITSGFLKRCSVHPDHYVVARNWKRN